MEKNALSGKKVLVTGAGGFIGSHLVDALVRSGAKVRAMVRYQSRGSWGWIEDLSKEIQSQVEVVQGDLRDQDRVFAICEGQDTVFHLGAMIAIPYSYVSPSEAHAVNTQGTFHVLTACRRFGVRRLVHTSTSEVYGTARQVPITEDHPLQGQSPYSASKIGADQLAFSFYSSFSTPVVTVRPFNTYGPRQSARAVIPTLIVQGLTQNRVKLGNLTPTRDFTYVTDTVAGMLAAATASGVEGQTFNLGVGQEISIGDLAKKIQDLIASKTGKRFELEQDRERLRPEKSEVERLLSSNEKAQRVLGWKPKVSLSEGLGQTLEWLKANLQSYERARTQYIV